MPRSRRFLASSSLLPLFLVVTTPAGATYSIVATDQATQAVGGAVASCVGSQGVLIVYGPAPGKGGINAQAAAYATGRDEGVDLLNMGVAPTDIITQITNPSFDPNYNNRQYGIADLQGRAAAFTGKGSSVAQWRGSTQGTLGTYTYSIQGNVLTGPAVVDQAETAFRGGGCDLAERLMLALEGGAQNGQGDNRCTPDGGGPTPANAASIEVDLIGQPEGSYLRLSNAKNGSANAVTQLRSQFNTWRQTHPCLQQDGGTPDASVDAGSKDASITDVTTDRRDGGDVSVGGDASDGAAGAGGSAGTAGQGGTAGFGGDAGAAPGGRGGTGGTSGAAGTAGTGGLAGTGGTTGGVGGTAGKGGTAGTLGTGGSGVGTGGATAGSAGATGTGGASGSTAGASSTGGRGGSGTGGSAGGGGSTSDDGGCSCRTVGGERSSHYAWTIIALSAIAAVRSRRAMRPRRSL